MVGTRWVLQGQRSGSRPRSSLWGGPGPAVPLIRPRKPCPGPRVEGVAAPPWGRWVHTLLGLTLQPWNQAQSFSNFSNWRESESVGCSVMSDSLCPMDSSLPGSSMGFSRQEYWSRLPFPSSGDLPNLGIEPRSPALQADSLPAEPQGKLFLIWGCRLLPGTFPSLTLATKCTEEKISLWQSFSRIWIYYLRKFAAT